MIKKILIYLIVLVFSAAALIVFSPLPYLPLIHLFRNSDVISGRISGSWNSGLRIKDLVIKATPAGEITAKEIVFSYSGLIDYYLRGRLIVKEIRWDTLQVNLPKGRMNNLSAVQKLISDNTYLLPPKRKAPLSSIEIQNVVINDLTLRVGKPDPGQTGLPVGIGGTAGLSPMALMMPLAFMNPLGRMSAAGAAPTTMAAAQARTAQPMTFRLDALEITNARTESLDSPKVSVLTRARVNGLVMEKDNFNLDIIDMESSTVNLLVKKDSNGDGYQISGAIRKDLHENMKKDFTITGWFARDRGFQCSLCDGKIAFTAGAKTPENPMPSAEFVINDFDLQDYFIDTAPLSKINYAYKMKNMFSGDKPVLYFNIGESKFGLIEGPKLGLSLFKPDQTEPVELASAQHTTWRDVFSTVLLDPAKRSRLLLRVKMNPDEINPKMLLARVWFGKDVWKLSPEEMNVLKAQAVYFGLSPADFEAPPAKIKAKPAKKARGARVKKRRR